MSVIIIREIRARRLRLAEAAKAEAPAKGPAVFYDASYTPLPRKKSTHVHVQFTDGAVFEGELPWVSRLCRGKITGTELSRVRALRALFTRKIGDRSFLGNLGYTVHRRGDAFPILRKWIGDVIDRWGERYQRHRPEGLSEARSRKATEAHKLWQRLANPIWRRQPDLSVRDVAKLVADQLAAEAAAGEQDAPRWRTIEKYISKPRG
jgi:hypothetical protein